MVLIYHTSFNYSSHSNGFYLVLESSVANAVNSRESWGECVNVCVYAKEVRECGWKSGSNVWPKKIDFQL